MASVAQELYLLVERTVEGLGYELVDVERAGGGLVRVTLDAPQASGGVTVHDCERVSHQLTHLFAVESVDYERLEVGSPGVDRPLKKARDYQRFEGEQVRLQLFAPLQGRKRYRGLVRGVQGPAGAERITLDVLADEAAPAEAARKAGGRAKTAPKTSRQAAPVVPVQTLEIALADIEKARLVPVLNFRSGRT